jgi:type II secretory pathway component GspD/PulD (secretin)
MVSGLPDVLVFSGTGKEVVRLHKLIPVLDTPAPEVSVVATVFEVDTDGADSSGVNLAFSLLGGKFTGGLPAVAGGAPVLALTSKLFTAALSLLSSDSRFHQVSNATLRVKSGESARMAVGSDVPILAASSVTGSGIATQSVDYRSVGVILTLRPLVLEQAVELTISQELSSAANTVSGVNGTPTISHRQVSTVVSARSGDVVVLGGLTDRQKVGQGSGLFFVPRSLWSNSTDSRSSEIVLLLRVQAVSGGGVPVLL